MLCTQQSSRLPGWGGMVPAARRPACPPGCLISLLRGCCGEWGPHCPPLPATPLPAHPPVCTRPVCTPPACTPPPARTLRARCQQDPKQSGKDPYNTSSTCNHPMGSKCPLSSALPALGSTAQGTRISTQLLQKD